MLRVLPQAQGAIVIGDLRESINRCERWLEIEPYCKSCVGYGFDSSGRQCLDCGGTGNG